MNLPIIARFKLSGSPQTGLTPTVTVRQIDQNTGSSTVVANSEAMTEIADGLYLYNFPTFNIRYNYVATFDAGAASDQRCLEAEYSGVQALLDAIPRSPGGTGSMKISKAQLGDISKQLKDYTKELFENITIEMDTVDLKDSKKELDKLIADFKSSAKKEKDAILKLIENKFKEVDKRLKEVSVPQITTETVDTSGFEKRMALSIQKQLKIEQEALDGLLADAVLLIRREIKENNEKYRDIVRAEVEAEVIAEFKNKLRQ